MQTLRVDIVSDIACPWCAIGYKRLEQAMEQMDGEIAFEIEWHPFELNPDAPPGGEDILAHLCQKYGRSEAEMMESQRELMEIADGLGLDFSGALERRSVSTFDAHRVLEWARDKGCRTELELALFDAYFGRAEDPSDPAVLHRIAESLGLDADEVDAIVASDRFADSVREEQARYTRAGVTAVPAFIINDRYLISGAQEPEALAAAFRKIVAEAPAPA